MHCTKSIRQRVPQPRSIHRKALVARFVWWSLSCPLYLSGILPLIFSKLNHLSLQQSTRPLARSTAGYSSARRWTKGPTACCPANVCPKYRTRCTRKSLTISRWSWWNRGIAVMRDDSSLSMLRRRRRWLSRGKLNVDVCFWRLRRWNGLMV